MVSRSANTTAVRRRVADVANGALDAPLLVAPRDGHGAWLEAVVGRQLEEHGVEANRVTAALEDGALEIVVEQHAGHAAEGGERVDVATEEEGHRRARDEAQEDAARVAEHHHERPEGALSAPDLQLSEVRPVDLRLLAGQRAQPLERLGRLAGAEPADDTAEVIGTARIAAVLDHREQPAGSQPRILLQLRDQERHEGVDDGRPRRNRLGVDADLPEVPPHRWQLESR